MPLLVSSIFLFYAGMAFAYFVVFPIMFGFFASVTPEGVSMMTDIGQYLDFVLTLFFAFGVAFEIPVATFLLIWVGIVDVATLRKSRPYVIVGCFAVGMVLTPPDVFSQSLLAVPMWLLFEAGVICGSMIRKREEHFRGDAEDDVRHPATSRPHHVREPPAARGRRLRRRRPGTAARPPPDPHARRTASKSMRASGSAGSAARWAAVGCCAWTPPRPSCR